jgi:hypothetical protein
LFRSDILSENTQKIHVVSKGRELTIIDGKIADDFQSVFDIYKDLILYRSRILLQKRLDMLGVDGSISSLGRFRGKIAYIVGAQYPDESASQVWLNKDTFRPIRWIMNGSGLITTGIRCVSRFIKMTLCCEKLLLIILI